jgi:hypothetical protein
MPLSFDRIERGVRQVSMIVPAVAQGHDAVAGAVPDVHRLPDCSELQAPWPTEQLQIKQAAR